MASVKKKAKPKTSRPAVKSSGFFVIAQGFDKTREDWQDEVEEAEVIGPISEAEALKTFEKKIASGCDRSKITVISGRKMSVEIKLK